MKGFSGVLAITAMQMLMQQQDTESGRREEPEEKLQEYENEKPVWPYVVLGLIPIIVAITVATMLYVVK